ncbi:hypothetical protein PF007_g1081 [Phytophthora fragariae]|uniref:Raptor N-terminal CASPase-like domain-containing protein n=1 Tax=Phytophthora fragariae TaxID=53985 RepID=A0A6A3TLT4_9STRA|nr:hypothetical protein PF007_g1081 [Phytophthora fragariae]
MAVTPQSPASSRVTTATNGYEPLSVNVNRPSERAGGLRFAQDAEKRKPTDEEDELPKPVEIVPWRMRERMKTMDVALVLCLNIGTDPPDVEKSAPCARKECWVDPFSMPAKKAIETIGNTLQSQYERWQPRARYKQSLDPTVEKIRELCVNRRRLAKHDRVLFHYNGHGVPRPTQNGEVWVFNKSYTQYIPLCQTDLVKDDGHSYFISHLAAGLHNGGGNQNAYSAAGNLMPPEQKVMAAFIISVICNDYLPGQKSCLPQYLHKICVNLLQDPDEEVPRMLGAKLRDERPEVRAAAAYALGTLVGFQCDPNVSGKQVDLNRLEEFLRQRDYPVHVPPSMEKYGRHEDFPPSLVSTCYERHKTHFSDPILEPLREDEDPLSEKVPRSHLRCRGPLQEEVKNFSLNLRQRAVLNNDAEMTSLLLFHPYETMLLVADEKDQISLYNFEETETKVLSFGNKNPPGSRLTSLNWINEAEESLLTCGSDDGVIKIYHGLHSPHPSIDSPKLLSAFVAVPDLVPGTRGSGLVMNWQQQAGAMYAGGNSSMLRGWDLRQEKCTVALPTQTDSCITSMASDESIPGMVVAGFGDGTLRIFDSRSRPDYSVKTIMREHASWVVQTHIYAGRNELLTGSVTGELKFWDLRYPKNSVKSLEAHRSPMTALAVHDYAPIFASGSHNQFIKVFRSDGEQLALIRYHEGFLGERIGPVSCLAFHPRRLFLAAGATDSVVAVYSSDN